MSELDKLILTLAVLAAVFIALAYMTGFGTALTGMSTPGLHPGLASTAGGSMGEFTDYAAEGN